MEFQRAAEHLVRRSAVSTTSLTSYISASISPRCNRRRASSNPFLRASARPAAVHTRGIFSSTRPWRQQAATAKKQEQEEEQAQEQARISDETPQDRMEQEDRVRLAQTYANPQRPVAQQQPTERSKAFAQVDFLSDSLSPTEVPDQQPSVASMQDEQPSPRNLIPDQNNPLSFLRNIQQQNTRPKKAQTSIDEMIASLRNRPVQNPIKSSPADPPPPSRALSKLNLSAFPGLQNPASRPYAPDTSPPASVDLKPSTGRLIVIAEEKNMDVARAFRALNSKVNINGVRYDSRTQRFHERPGMARKRLKRTRWRKRFGEGFKATVQRVMELRKKGW